MRRQSSRVAGGLGALVLAWSIASGGPAGTAQEPKPDPKGDKEAPPADGAKESLQVAAGIEVEAFGDDQWSKAKRIEKPLLLYSDDTRGHNRGSVWGWGEKGRPVALLELFQDEDDRTSWVFALCNTSGGKVRASRGGMPWWEENESVAELKDVPNAPVVAADPAQRQRQLKQLAQKFTGHEFWDPNNTRYALRRLARPLHTYRDEAAGILEGGLFTLANGTNPEIMLFVEARADPKAPGKPVWQFTVGRLAHAELHLEYDSKEVFSAPRGRALSGRSRPYWLSYIQSPVLDDPGK